jgi:uncharacterized protein YndB with AHSA1/START domain
VVRKILIGIAAVIAVFLIVVATRPSSFHLERSVVIAAPPEAVFAQVNDLHAWAAWSPYETLDPQVKKTFEGAPAGAGAIFRWAGNDKVGEGWMTTEKSEKPSYVELKVASFKPWPSIYVTSFTFAPAPEGTTVTWAVDGQYNFMDKATWLFKDKEKLVGGDFERGLAAMKVAAERAKADFETNRAAQQK